MVEYMAKVKVRFACTLCDCVCDKKPYFKNWKIDYSPSSHMIRARREAAKELDPANESGWVCESCLHPAKNHIGAHEIGRTFA